MKTVEVAAAVIIDQDRVFATQRGYGPFKDKWEFPGGKLEAGEKPAEALVREIREELAVDIIPGRYLACIEYDYPEFHLKMHCFLAALSGGRPILLEHEDARWFRKDELAAADFLPADREVARLLQAEEKAG